MTKTTNRLCNLKKILRASTAAGLAAAVVYVGTPAVSTGVFAAPVKVENAASPGFATVVSVVSPAVVSVRVEGVTKQVADASAHSGLNRLPDNHPLRRFFDQFGGNGLEQSPDEDGRSSSGRRSSQGSGFFISDDGYLVTNNHVVEGGSSYSVLMDDGTELKAELVGSDSRTDLAVLKVAAKRKFTYVDFADSTKTRVGDWVVAVGNPFGLGGSVTAGIVSAVGRDIGSGPYDDYLQIDAAVNRGNSGGPAFNMEGEVVGINTAIFSPSGGNVGIAFAIPASVAKSVVKDLIEDGKVERGWLGLQIQPVNKDIAEALGLQDAHGALVAQPQEGSPGAIAGLTAGDVILAMNGEPIKDARALSMKVAEAGPQKKVELSVWRGGKSQTIEVTLGDLASMDGRQSAPTDKRADPDAGEELSAFGLTVVPAQGGAGLLVTNVDPDAAAATRGISEGDIISSINNRRVSTPKEANDIVTDARNKHKSNALLQITGEEGSRFVAVPLAES